MIGALKGINSAIASLSQFTSVQKVVPVRPPVSQPFEDISQPLASAVRTGASPVGETTGISGNMRLGGLLSASSLSSFFSDGESRNLTSSVPAVSVSQPENKVVSESPAENQVKEKPQKNSMQETPGQIKNSASAQEADFEQILSRREEQTVQSEAPVKAAAFFDGILTAQQNSQAMIMTQLQSGTLGRSAVQSYENAFRLTQNIQKI